MNPNSGASNQQELVRNLEKQLQNRGFQPQVLTDLERVRRLAFELHESNDLRVVVSAGGDGTISRLLNELSPDIPLAIFPLGTENLMAKYLYHSADPIQFTEMIESGLTLRLDSGLANGKRFLIMASCGFDADVVQRLHSQRKGHIRHWSYAKPIFESIASYPYPPIQVWVDDEPEPIQCRWAFVFNVPRYAMNLPIVTESDPTDGQFELCSFREGNLFRGLYYLAAVITGRHRYSSESQFCQFRRMRIGVKEPDQVVPYQIDGDPGGTLPLSIEVVPKSLRLVVTSGWIDKNVWLDQGSVKSK
jgi:diacylglycerol kinase family enzyme